MDNSIEEQIWLLSSKNMAELIEEENFSEKLCLNRNNSNPIDILDKKLNPILEDVKNISLGTFFIDIDVEDKVFIYQNLKDKDNAQKLFEKYNVKSDNKAFKVFKHKTLNIFLTKSFDEKNYVNSNIENINEYWLLSYLQTICVYLKNENISKYKFNFILHDKDFNKEMNGKIEFNELELKKCNYLRHTDFKDVEGLSATLNEMWGFQHTDSDYIFKDIIANPDFFDKESLVGKTAHEKLLEVLNIENLVEDFFNSLN